MVEIQSLSISLKLVLVGLLSKLNSLFFINNFMLLSERGDGGIEKSHPCKLG